MIREAGPVQGPGLEVELITSGMANGLVNHGYIMKPPSKSLNDMVWRAAGLLNISRCWEGGVPGEAPSPSPNSFFYVSLPSGCS